MFRTLALALVTVASLSAPAFAIGPHFGSGGGGNGGGAHVGGVGPHFGSGGGGGGSHFAGGGGAHFGGGHFQGGFSRGGVIVVGGGSCWRTVWTDFGPRRVFVCD